MANNKIESQMPKCPVFVVFSSGSNSIDQLEERLGERPLPLKGDWLYGFERAFFGNSKKWGNSTTTLIPGEKVAGLFIKFRSVAYPSKYQVQTVNGWKACTFEQLIKDEAVEIGKYQLKQISKYEDVPLFAFIHSSSYSDLSFRRPSDDYIKAIAKTLLDRRTILGQSLSRDPYVIDVRGIGYVPNPPICAVVTSSLNNVIWKKKYGSYWIPF